MLLNPRRNLSVQRIWHQDLVVKDVRSALRTQVA